MEAEAREVRGEARFRAGDAEVGGAGDAKAAADGRAMHGRDDWLLGAQQAHRLLVKMVGWLAADRGRRFVLPLGIVEVRASAERFALGAKNDGAHAVIPVELLHRGGNLLDELHVEEVMRRAA